MRMPDPRHAPGTLGDLRSVPDYECLALGRSADLTVWLPEDYASSGRRYGVVYFFDGHNLYDPAESAYGRVWHADVALSAADVIGVGVPCHPTERLEEYSPHFSDYARERFGTEEGHDLGEPRGHAYLEFLVEQLKPDVDATFRTLPGPEHTAVVGSSAGGSMAAWCWAQRPDVFGLAGIMSPALWVGGSALREDLARAFRAGARGRLAVDVGGRESDEPALVRAYVDACEDLVRMARANRRTDVRYEFVSDAIHSETAWARRLPGVLDFLYPRTEQGAA